MTDRIRFHLDENVDPAVAERLRRRGIDVTTTPETGLLRASDGKQIEFALSEERTLVTQVVAQNDSIVSCENLISKRRCRCAVVATLSNRIRARQLLS